MFLFKNNFATLFCLQLTLTLPELSLSVSHRWSCTAVIESQHLIWFIRLPALLIAAAWDSKSREHLVLSNSPTQSNTHFFSVSLNYLFLLGNGIKEFQQACNRRHKAHICYTVNKVLLYEWQCHRTNLFCTS